MSPPFLREVYGGLKEFREGCIGSTVLKINIGTMGETIGSGEGKVMRVIDKRIWVCFEFGCETFCLSFVKSGAGEE